MGREKLRPEHNSLAWSLNENDCMAALSVIREYITELNALNDRKRNK